MSWRSSRCILCAFSSAVVTSLRTPAPVWTSKNVNQTCFSGHRQLYLKYSKSLLQSFLALLEQSSGFTLAKETFKCAAGLQSLEIDMDFLKCPTFTASTMFKYSNMWITAWIFRDAPPSSAAARLLGTSHQAQWYHTWRRGFLQIVWHIGPDFFWYSVEMEMEPQ